MPTDAEIAQVKLNVNNLIAFNNHLHDYLQDPVNEVYDKLSVSSSYDPLQKFITTVMDASLWSLSAASNPGAAILSSFLGTFYGAYTNDTPPSLSGTFGNVWARFSQTFLQANDDLAAIYADPSGTWDKSYTDPTTNITVTVSQLGSPDVQMPGDDSPDFQTATDTVVAAFRYNLTKNTIGKKWNIVPDMHGEYEKGWDEATVRSWIPSFVKAHPAYYVSYSPYEKGMMMLENCLSSSHSAGSAASKDLCFWLFRDDGAGTLLNENGIADRWDVFCNWGLPNSVTPPT
jgi:hypothetical protein